MCMYGCMYLFIHAQCMNTMNTASMFAFVPVFSLVLIIFH